MLGRGQAPVPSAPTGRVCNQRGLPHLGWEGKMPRVGDRQEQGPEGTSSAAPAPPWQMADGGGPVRWGRGRTSGWSQPSVQLGCPPGLNSWPPAPCDVSWVTTVTAMSPWASSSALTVSANGKHGRQPVPSGRGMEGRDRPSRGNHPTPYARRPVRRSGPPL